MADSSSNQQTHQPADELSGVDRRVIVIAPPRQTVWWVISILLAIIATAVIVRRDDSVLGRALAQTGNTLAPQMAGARGIYAFTGQLTSKSYGLFMMDVDSGTIWCYELQHGSSGEPQLKLVAARSWIFDRYLEEFNAADPIPSAVRVLVQQQRSAAAGGAGAAGPATLPAPARTP